MLVKNNLHLNYCTQVFSGATLADLRENIQNKILPVKTTLVPHTVFAVGLWLSSTVVAELLQDSQLAQFKQWLSINNLYVVTLNSFSFGNLQQTKQQIYLPDWSDPQRFSYTKNLIHILQVLLPEGIEGSISTSPLSYKPWHTMSMRRENILQKCCAYLLNIVDELKNLYLKTGKLIHLDLEPAPDGLLESMDDVVEFFNHYLCPFAQDETSVRRHIQVCYDIAHAAVKYVDHTKTWECLQDNGIQIGKVQISSVIKVDFNLMKLEQQYIELLNLSHSPYLHQVIMRNEQNILRCYADLTHALHYYGMPGVKEWRIHYRCPIYLDRYLTMSTTQSEIIAILKLITLRGVSPHLEIETDISNNNPKANLTPLILQEYQWLLTQLLSIFHHEHQEAILCKRV